jgi:hypothetical protein
VIVRIFDMEATDAVVEPCRQAGQTPGRYTKQRVDLVRRQLHPEFETSTGRVPEELLPEAGVRE